MAARIRLLTQAAFLVLSLSVFFGFAADRRVISFYHALHLFPVLAQAPWVMLPPLAGVTVILLLVTLAVGRLYCSFLCPVGFVQDLARRLGRTLLPGRAAAGWTGLRFFILALCLVFLALQSSAYHYFDHFSNLGRVYGLARGPWGWNSFLGFGFLVVVVLVPLRWPRWFCGAVCPSGTLFMLLQQAAPGKVRAGGCGRGCGKCAPVCPVLCLSEGGIDERLCINCLECLPACPEGALSFSFRLPRPARAAEKAVPAREGLSRREFLAAAGLSLSGAASGFFLKRRFMGPGPANAVVPPGGKAFASFLERCVACGACVSICPTRVLAPAGRELGLSGLAKVRLDFGRGYCAYECNACLAVCPSGAISYFPSEIKKRIRIGKSRLVKDFCIPYAFERDCGACQEVCPTGAITMEPFGPVYAPVRHEDYCIGCGACQFACPTRPRKAIVVDPVEVHSFARAPTGNRGRHGPRGPAPEEPAFPF